MSPECAPESLPVPFATLVSVGVEHWRLARWLKEVGGETSSAAAPARHAVRRIEDFLRACEFEVHTMDARPFDAGLAVHVVDTIDDAALAEGDVRIDETLSPMVLWRGTVVRAAEVVTRRGTGTKPEGA
jgi:hypothetical protein